MEEIETSPPSSQSLDSEVPSQLIPLRARPSRLPPTFAALSHRNFQLYFGGQLISVAGTWMQAVAQQWLVYQISKSELTLGLVAFASAVPALLFTPWGGVVVDRVPKRTLLVATQSTAMLLAFILAALAFNHVVQVWHVVLLAAGLGLVNAFDGPGRQAFVVEMVGKHDMPNAIAMNSTMFNLARVFGPALGGLAYAGLGPGWCFLLNGLSFLAVIGGLLAMQVPPHQPKPRVGSPLSQLAGGLRYVRGKTDLSGLILLALIFSLFGLSYSTLLPAFVDQVLRRGAADFGLINAATGLGAVTGALLIATYGESRGRRGQWLAMASLGFPLVLLAFANMPLFIPSLVLAYGLGLGFMIQFTLINTLLQTRVDDQMRGRVLSLYTITFFGVAPLGYLAIGALAQTWGLSLTISLNAIAAGALGMALLAVNPQIRRLA